jgi:iron(II)-dependent oxidoreductase
LKSAAKEELMSPTSVASASRPGELQARLEEARARSDELFEIVRPEALYDRPIPERHRVVFYLGHLEAFDWNLLREPLGGRVFHAEFDKLFAFGIDPVGGGLPTDQPRDWPSIEAIRNYNRRIRAQLDEALTAFDSGQQQINTLLEVAIEHRLMHAETLAYMLHQLAPDRKYPVDAKTSPCAPPRTLHRVEISLGAATLGLSRAVNQFGWDNEFEEHRVEVPAFTIDAHSVSNGDFLAFVQEGGYTRRDLWSAAGWAWIGSSRHTHPAFWVPNGDGWLYRGMFAATPLPVDWPVYVSHDEASAYAKWAGKELPSEGEWHRAACGTRNGGEQLYPWGNEAPSSRRGNFDFHRWDPVPAGSYPEGASDFGVADLVGNGWEWTRTPFAPFAGFQPFPFYPGYSANFFDGHHYVMKGGSPRTARCMLRRSFRNWFQPHYPYVYAKFRCVEH